MMRTRQAGEDAGIVRGEFLADGETFILRLADTPISGVGRTPDEAWANLLSTRAAAGELPARLAALAREQEGEAVRAKIVQMAMIALIVLGVTAGALVSAAAMAPKVAGLMVQAVTAKADKWLDEMPPERAKKFDAVLDRFGASARAPATPQDDSAAERSSGAPHPASRP